jgi:hypothetical protein
VQITREASRYRLRLLDGYMRHEKAAVRTVRDTMQEIVEAVGASNPKGMRSFSAVMRPVDAALVEQGTALRKTLDGATRDIANLTLRYHSERAGVQLVSQRAVIRATTSARRAVIAGKNVADRVTLLGGTQRSAVRLRLLQGLRRGEAPESIAKAITKYYAGVVDGRAGPAYAARRLVQSELTRMNGLVAEHAAYRLRKDKDVVTVFVFRTQGDDRVRDTHEALEGEEFVEDVVAENATTLRPISEAQEALSDINCRCWLDVAYYL